MIDVGIADADLLAIHRQDDATSGQIVMGVLTDRTTGEHEVTLKRFRVEPHRFLLLSENRQGDYASIVIPRKAPRMTIHRSFRSPVSTAGISTWAPVATDE